MLQSHHPSPCRNAYLMVGFGRCMGLVVALGLTSMRYRANCMASYIWVMRCNSYKAGKKAALERQGLPCAYLDQDKLEFVLLLLLEQACDDMASTCCIAGDRIEEVVFKSGLLSSVGLLRLGFSFLQNYISDREHIACRFRNLFRASCEYKCSNRISKRLRILD